MSLNSPTVQQLAPAAGLTWKRRSLLLHGCAHAAGAQGAEYVEFNPAFFADERRLQVDLKFNQAMCAARQLPHRVYLNGQWSGRETLTFRREVKTRHNCAWSAMRCMRFGIDLDSRTTEAGRAAVCPAAPISPLSARRQQPVRPRRKPPGPAGSAGLPGAPGAGLRRPQALGQRHRCRLCALQRQHLYPPRPMAAPGAPSIWASTPGSTWAIGTGVTTAATATSTVAPAIKATPPMCSAN